MRERNELEGMLHDAAGRLSPAHVAALVAHPEAVRSALAAADALTAGGRERRSEVEMIAGPVLPTVDATEADRRLSARAREGAPERLLTSEELAARTGLRTRQTVHDGPRKGRIVGWQNARRGYVFPAEQLDGRNRPTAGTRPRGRAVRRRLRRVDLADDAAAVARRGAAARAPGAGRGRTRGRGRERRPAGRLCVTRGYDPERLRAELRAVRIERGPPWDEPELDEIILSSITSSRRRAEEGD